MSYTNVYPSRINWENEPSIVSPINATNLNKMDYALYQMDQTFDTWDVTKANQSDLLLSVKSIDYDTDTGVFVFTWQNGTTKTVDLNIEKIPVSFSMNANGVITMTTDDGTTYTADVGALIKTYTFTDSSEIDFTVTTDSSGNKTVTASIVAGSITGSKLEPNYLANCQSAANSASGSATAADGSAEDSEAWAVGTRDGVPVPSTDPAYNNNSKYWATQGGANSLAGLSDTDINSPTDGQGLVYNYSTSKWINGNVSSGSTITVFTNESSLYGRTVTLTIGQQTKTETFSNVGVAVFKGIVSTGTFTISSSTSGGDTATTTLDVPYFGNYTKQLTLFNATVTVTFPYSDGASCTITDGVTTLTANTSPMAFNVPNVGTWTATCTIDGVSAPTQSAVITTDGQTETMTFAFGTINLTYDNAFRGLTITCVNGGTTISKTAPISGNTMAFYPPSTGEWIISATYSGVPYQTSATITSLATPVSASLQQVPNGKTVTPTDDIQKWLNCAGIFDKTSYTTLADVLADSTTLLALMSNNNAVDYLVRSTTWASNSALVPIMTDNTTPSGECFGTTPNASNTDCYKAFDGDDSISYYSPNITGANVYIGYDFGVETSVSLVRVVMSSGQSVPVSFKIQGSNTSKTDGYTDISSEVTLSNNEDRTFSLTATSSYRYYRLYVTNISAGRPYVKTIQFYPLETSITANSTAMTDIGANNYCADTLLADSTWCSAICNSTYYESVLNVSVPTMTSNTTPSGTASASSTYSASYAAWKAFDKTYATNDNWMANTDSDSWLAYQFTSAVTVYAAWVKNRTATDTNTFPRTYKIQGSNDGFASDVHDLTDTITGVDEIAGEKIVPITNIGSYTDYRIYVNDIYRGSNMAIGGLQFYGRQDI